MISLALNFLGCALFYALLALFVIGCLFLGCELVRVDEINRREDKR